MKITKSCYAVLGLADIESLYVNAGFIIGENETIIIDSSLTIESAKTILGYAKAAAPKNKIAYVINTEASYSHIFGNVVFKKEGALIIGHKKSAIKKSDIAKAIKKMSNSKKQGSVFFQGIEPLKPDITINKNHVLPFGEKEIVIITTNINSTPKLLIYFKEEDIVFSGNLLISSFEPRINVNSKKELYEWLKALDSLEVLKPKFIVPSHGPICKGKEISQEINRHRDILKKMIKNYT